MIQNLNSSNNKSQPIVKNLTDKIDDIDTKVDDLEADVSTAFTNVRNDLSRLDGKISAVESNTTFPTLNTDTINPVESDTVEVTSDKTKVKKLEADAIETSDLTVNGTSFTQVKDDASQAKATATEAKTEAEKATEKVADVERSVKDVKEQIEAKVSTKGIVAETGDISSITSETAEINNITANKITTDEINADRITATGLLELPQEGQPYYTITIPKNTSAAFQTGNASFTVDDSFVIYKQNELNSIKSISFDKETKSTKVQVVASDNITYIATTTTGEPITIENMGNSFTDFEQTPQKVEGTIIRGYWTDETELTVAGVLKAYEISAEEQTFEVTSIDNLFVNESITLPDDWTASGVSTRSNGENGQYLGILVKDGSARPTWVTPVDNPIGSLSYSDTLLDEKTVAAYNGTAERRVIVTPTITSEASLDQLKTYHWSKNNNIWQPSEKTRIVVGDNSYWIDPNESVQGISFTDDSLLIVGTWNDAQITNVVELPITMVIYDAPTSVNYPITNLGDGTVVHGDITADKFIGEISGNADSATKLKEPAKINGTDFDGTEDITTEKWGSKRNISIADSTGTYVSTATEVDGSENVTLKLPTTFTGNVKGGTIEADSVDTTSLTSETIETDTLTAHCDTCIEGNTDINGNVNIGGDLTVAGTVTTAHSEEVVTPSENIILRDGSVVPISAGSYSGFVSKNYDGNGKDFQVGIDQTGTLHIGVEGETMEPVATRAASSSMEDSYVAKWNSTGEDLETSGTSCTHDLCVDGDLTATGTVQADCICGSFQGAAVNSSGTDYTTCTGTVTNIQVKCGTTVKSTITGTGSIDLSPNAFNTYATVDTTTYPGVCCTGTSNYVITTKVCCSAKVNCTAVTNNADRNILLGETTSTGGENGVNVSNSCKLTYNPSTGALCNYGAKTAGYRLDLTNPNGTVRYSKIKIAGTVTDCSDTYFTIDDYTDRMEVNTAIVSNVFTISEFTGNGSYAGWCIAPISGVCDCFWLRYGGYRVPKVNSTIPFVLEETTTTAPTGVTWIAPKPKGVVTNVTVNGVDGTVNTSTGAVTVSKVCAYMGAGNTNNDFYVPYTLTNGAAAEPKLLYLPTFSNALTYNPSTGKICTGGYERNGYRAAIPEPNNVVRYVELCIRAPNSDGSFEIDSYGTKARVKLTRYDSGDLAILSATYTGISYGGWRFGVKEASYKCTHVWLAYTNGRSPQLFSDYPIDVISCSTTAPTGMVWYYPTREITNVTVNDVDGTVNTSTGAVTLSVPIKSSSWVTNLGWAAQLDDSGNLFGSDCIRQLGDGDNCTLLFNVVSTANPGTCSVVVGANDYMLSGSQNTIFGTNCSTTTLTDNSCVTLIGSKNSATGSEVTAVGVHNTLQIAAMAFGLDNVVGSSGIAVGCDQSVSVNSIGIGYYNNTADCTVAIGCSNKVSSNGIAIGKDNDSNTYSVAIGVCSCACTQGVAIGCGAFGSAVSVAIGRNAKVSGYCAVGIGYCSAASSQAVSIGCSATSCLCGVSVGMGAFACGCATAIGACSCAYPYTVAIGRSAKACCYNCYFQPVIAITSCTGSNGNTIGTGKGVLHAIVQVGNGLCYKLLHDCFKNFLQNNLGTCASCFVAFGKTNAVRISDGQRSLYDDRFLIDYKGTDATDCLYFNGSWYSGCTSGIPFVGCSFLIDFTGWTAKV